MSVGVKVSVLCITYNQAAFVAQALDSMLAQEVAFPMEIVVGDDCSTDGTREILQQYAERRPDMFRLLLRHKNLGMFGNLRSTLEACSGQYVAVLEGDDYWTSTQKLRRQADFLDANPWCSTCFHAVTQRSVVPGVQSYVMVPPGQRTSYALDDLLACNIIPTCSVMFRGDGMRGLPDWMAGLKMCDWPMHVLNAFRGTVGYLDENMSDYRVHTGGSWTAMGEIERTKALVTVHGLFLRNLQLSRNRKRLVLAAMRRNLVRLAGLYWADRQYEAQCNAIWRSVRAHVEYGVMPPIGDCVLLARLYFRAA
jgi:glycosyltransferase involved in cell wall biosynthesis